MKLLALVFLLICSVSACSNASREVAAPPAGSAPYVVMDFSKPMAIDALPQGWHQRKFSFVEPMRISLVEKAGRSAIRLQTHASASMLIHDVNIGLDQLNVLRWGWFVEQPVVTEFDELTAKGDDHPARLYLKFLAADGTSHAMEIIWGNTKLKGGDWKYLKSFWHSHPFPHYVARGGQSEIGRWHDERVNLRELYRKQWGDPTGVRLHEVALFCDTDQTGASSIAYFSAITAEPGS